jgi:hypothetical protein
LIFRGEKAIFSISRNWCVGYSTVVLGEKPKKSIPAPSAKSPPYCIFSKMSKDALKIDSELYHNAKFQ